MSHEIRLNVPFQLATYGFHFRTSQKSVHWIKFPSFFVYTMPCFSCYIKCEKVNPICWLVIFLILNILIRTKWHFCFNPGAPGLRNTGGAGCWQQVPFSTFKADFERHRKDSDKRFFPKLAGAVFWQKQLFKKWIT